MDVSKAYRILLRVTEKGFDTVGFSYRGISLVIKTITPHELDMVRYHTSGTDLFSFRMYRMAYATFIFNGELVLDNRQLNLQKLVNFYGRLPLEVFYQLEEAALRLQNRYKRYCSLVEGFSYSQPARLLWRTRKGSPLLSTEVTNIPGTSLVGIPECVSVWELINMSLDQEIDNDRMLSNALFLTSATNPKGSMKIGSSIKGEKELISKNRNMLIEYGSEAHKHVCSKSSVDKKDRWTAKLDTAKDIMDELERQMHGVQDKHDLFIEGYREKLRNKLKEREESEKKRLDEVRRQRGGDPHTGSFEVTQEEMNSIMKGEVTHMDLARRKAEGDRVKGMESAVPPVRPGSTGSVGKRVIGAPRGVVG